MLWRKSVRRSNELKVEPGVFREGRGFGKSKIIDASLEPEGVCRQVCRNRIDGVESSELAVDRDAGVEV
jgi:hypothetical protein